MLWDSPESECQPGIQGTKDKCGEPFELGSCMKGINEWFTKQWIDPNLQLESQDPRHGPYGL